MRPLEDWPRADRQAITGVLTDIDDTLTTDGDITPPALQALQALHAAGLPVVAITGRPVGWSEQLAARWPLAAVVAENGAVALVRQPETAGNASHGATGVLSKLYVQDAVTRAANRARMQAVLHEVVSRVPGAMAARDSAGRETDIAVDHSEFASLSPQQIEQVVAVMQSHGMTATVSSIHINGWYGNHNKLTGARWILQTLWGRDLAAERTQWVYTGDSTNDQLLFAYLPNSIGVANVRRFAAQLTDLPRYVTPGERGQGFADMVASLLLARGGGR